MIISRYITREVVSTLLGITFVLLLAFLSQQLVRYLNFVAIGKIPTNVLFKLVSFEIPYILSFLLPLGFYLAVLLVYGRLYADNEMSIMQMYGYNHSRILRLTMMMAVVTAVGVFFLMAWVNPMVSAKRQAAMASDETTLSLVQTLIPGRFQESPDGRHVIYVEKLSRNRLRAQNIFLAQEIKNKEEDRDHSNWMLIFANEAYQAKDINSQDQFFITEDGYRYEGIPGQNDYKIIQFKKYAVRIPEREVHIKNEINETLSISQLWRDYSMPRRAAEFQWRISLAILTLILAVLAIPLSTVRPRQGRYIILIPAILIYIIYIDLLYVAKHWVVIGTIPISIGMWWVHAILGLLAVIIFLLHYQRGT